MTDDSDRKQPRNPLGPTGSRVMANVKKLRQAQGLSYKDLSDRLEGLDRPIPVLGLSRLERGDRRVDVDDLMALAVALGTTPNRLILPPGELEHSGERHRITPAITEVPPLIWAWAAGEVPLGHLPSTAGTDRQTRAEEVAFSRENRPHHWLPDILDRTMSERRAYAAGHIAVRVAEAFAAGMSTADIRSLVEDTLMGALLDPGAGQAGTGPADRGQAAASGGEDDPKALPGEDALWPSRTNGT